MPLRDTFKRVFHRSSSSKDMKNGKPKVEYYRRHEIPPSKFRGPFDKEHQKRLAAWSFDGAMAERSRASDDLSLSPCATYDLPDGPFGPLDPLDRHDAGDVSPDDDGVPIDPEFTDSDASVPELLDSSRPTVGSQSSTIVNSSPDSYSGSMMTLLPEEDHPIGPYELSEDPITLLKESIRYTSPIVRAMSPASPRPIKGKTLPFSAEDLTRALNAVQVCG